MTDGDSSAGRERTYVPLVRRYFCSTVRTYMFVVRTRTHLAPKIKTERTKDKKDKKTEILGTKRRKKSYLFFSNFRVLVCCLQLSVVIDLAESTVLSTVPHSLSPADRRHLDQGKEGYLLYGLRKGPNCKAPHIHRNGLFIRNMGQVHIGGCAANQNVSGH